MGEFRKSVRYYSYEVVFYQIFNSKEDMMINKLLKSMSIMLAVIMIITSMASTNGSNVVHALGYDSIYDIRSTEDVTATIKGIVTAKFGTGTINYYVQDVTGGIVVRVSDFEANIGDEIQATGVVEFYHDMSQLKPASGADCQVLNENVGEPEPQIVLGTELDEAVEGELVTVNNAQVVEVDKYGNYTCQDENSNEFIVNPEGFDLEVGITYVSLTGVINYSYNAYKLVPRMVVDVNHPDYKWIANVRNTTSAAITIKGVVTAAFGSGTVNYFVQDESAGIVVRVEDFTANIGDEITAMGDIKQFYDMAQLKPAAAIDCTVVTVDKGEPDSQIVLAEDFTESIEAELVTVNEVFVVEYVDHGEYNCKDEKGNSFVVDSDDFDLVADKTYTSITGVINYSYGNYKLTPRMAEDIVSPQASMPIATPAAGIVEAGTKVTLSTPSEADIYYTIDGSLPETTTSSSVMLYSEEIVVNENMTIKAIAAEADKADSDVATFEYTILDDSLLLSISEARTKEAGDPVATKGIVTHIESGTLLYIQDATAGIKVDTFGKDVDLSGYKVGDELKVIGAIDIYKDEMEISVEASANITKESADNEVPTAKEITITSLKAGENQGEFVKLPLVKVKAVDKYNINIVDIEGNATKIYHAKAKNFETSDVEVDGWYSIAGIAAWYGGEQIKLRDGSDIKEAVAPVDPSLSYPIIYNVAPANMSTIYTTTAIVSATIEKTVDDIDMDSIELTVDGQVIAHTVDGLNISAEINNLPLGEHDVKVVVKDVSNREQVKEWYFVIAEEVNDYTAYFGIPHCHTSYSDGKATPADAFQHAKDNDLDWLFVTDHSNWFDGVAYEPKTSAFADPSSSYYDESYDLNYEYNKNTNQYEEIEGSEWYKTRMEVEAFNDANDDFLALRGFEMTFGDVGHINVIDSEAYVEAKSQMTSLVDFYDWIENLSEAQSENTLVSFNHPGWPADSFYNQSYVPELDKEISMMEVGNGAPPYSYARSEEQFIRALDNGWHLGATNAQDNHSTNWGDPDNLTGVVAKSLSEADIKEAITNRRVYSTETRNLDLTVKANGYWMGSVVDVAQGDTLDFEIIATDNEEPIVKLQIMTNGGAIIAEEVLAAPNTTATWNPSITVPAGANWYVVKVIHENGKWGTASPIFTPESDSDVKFTKIEVNPEITLPGYETAIKATVSNMGVRVAENIEVKFYLNSVSDATLLGTTVIPLVAPGESEKAEGTFVPTVDGETKIIAMMTEVPGLTTVTEISTTINVVKANGKTVMIDDAHGNYDAIGGIGEVISLLRQYGYTVVVATNKITANALDGVDVFMATQPRGDLYTSDEKTAIADWVDAGGAIFLAAKSNYSDDPTRFNHLLEYVGTEIRFNDDNVYEPEDSKYYNGGMVWSVYSYNLPETDSKINENMEAIRMFSTCSLVNSQGEALVNNPATGLEILLAGNDSSYTYDPGKQTGSGYTYNLKGELNGETIPMIAKEEVGNGRVAVAGRHFFSDFEIGNDVSNTALTLKLVDWLADYDRIMTIQDVRNGYANGTINKGDIVTVKGTAIVDEETLFDVIYIQDQTSGISLYGSYQDNPADVFEGTEVIATGKVTEFEGEIELAYDNYETNILYVGFDEKIAPQVLSTKDAMKSQYTGMLLQTKGYIKEINETGSYFKIDDGSGTSYIHVDGYVASMDNLKIGDYVCVKGIGSHGSNGPRIRVRYADDIKKAQPPVDPTPTPDPDPEPADPSPTPDPQPTPDPEDNGGVDDGEVIVDVDVDEDESSATATFSGDELEAAKENGTDAVVETEMATITIGADTLLEDTEGKSVKLTVEKIDTLPEGLSDEDKAKVEGKTVYDFSLYLDNEKVSNFNSDDPIKVTIPYELGEDEDPDQIVVYYIDDEGNLVQVTGSYDAITGTVTFETDHFSLYTIFEVDVPFTDLNEVIWAKNYIQYLAARNIVEGETATTFAPSKDITREEYIAMIVRAYGLVDEDAKCTFTDIDKNAKFYQELATAQKLGITKGIGNNEFGYGELISREQMATIVYRALEVLGETLPVVTEKTTFKDDKDIADYAKKAVYEMQKAGIIIGEGNGIYNPDSNATKAESSKIVYYLVK